MKQSLIIVLVFLTFKINAQCTGFVAHGNGPDSLFMVNTIRERRLSIDKTYDSIIHFSYDGRKFCRSKFCDEISKVSIEAYLKNGKANKIIILANTIEGKLTTQYYFWEEKMFALQSFEYLADKAPKRQWKNANGIPGWMSEGFICDRIVFSVKVMGVKERSMRKWTNFERQNPSGRSDSNSRPIVDDLISYTHWIISEDLKIKKGIDIDYIRTRE